MHLQTKEFQDYQQMPEIRKRQRKIVPQSCWKEQDSVNRTVRSQISVVLNTSFGDLFVMATLETNTMGEPVYA